MTFGPRALENITFEMTQSQSSQGFPDHLYSVIPMGKGRHSRPPRHPRLRKAAGLSAVVLSVGVLAPLGLQTATNGSDQLVPKTFHTTTTIPVNPFEHLAVKKFLARRENVVTASLCDLRTGRVYNFNPGRPLRTASMVKIDILAALLHKYEKLHKSLSEAQKHTAELMVEHSDNDAATMLFNDLGGPDVLNAFNTSIGMSQTKSEWDWGATLTTPYDEIALLRTLVLPGAVLTDEDRQYELDLMEHVVGYQRFGVGEGLPAEALVGLKNGWFPYDTGWGINTAGYVMLGNTEYLLAIQTGSNPDQRYGRDTVSTLSSLLWKAERSISAIPIPSFVSTN